VFFIHVMKAVSDNGNIQPSEALTSFIQINVFWNVTQSSLIHAPDVLQQYDTIIFMAGEIALHFYKTTLRHIPEDGL
jgi:hypothetical protein